MSSEIKIAQSWKPIFQQEFDKPYFKLLTAFIKQEELLGKIIFPLKEETFAAFEKAELENTRVVILGQDPYHGIGQAHGLCFSVNNGIAIPPSLQNIYKELKSDIPNYSIPTHGNLSSWANQGVLLLNTTLTVEKDKPGSHQGKGWEQFTDNVIHTLSTQNKKMVFILWGNFAQKKASLVDGSKHLILTAAHPSPLSAYRGFLGCKHFSKTNNFLELNGLKPINW